MESKPPSLIGRILEVLIEVVLTLVLTPFIPSLLSVAWGVFLYQSTMFSKAVGDYPLQIALAAGVSFALGLYLGFTVRILSGYVRRERNRERDEEKQREDMRRLARSLSYDKKLLLMELSGRGYVDVERSQTELKGIRAIEPMLVEVSEVARDVLRVGLTDYGRHLVDAASDILGEARPDAGGMWWES